MTFVQGGGDTYPNGASLISSQLKPHWPSATTAGNLLVAGILTPADPGTITPPATVGNAWTLFGSDSTNGVFLSVFTCLNAGSQSTANKIWTFANTEVCSAMVLGEYSGVATASATDNAQSINTGTSTATLATSTITTTNASDVLISFACALRATTGGQNFSGPTNSFAFELQKADNDGSTAWITIGLCDRVVTSTGSYSHNLTCATSADFYTTAIQSFKAPASATPTFPLTQDPPVPCFRPRVEVTGY